MSKGLLFFLCSCIILALSIINLSIGPIVNKKLGENDSTTLGSNWGTLNCEYYKDQYEDKKGQLSGKKIKYVDGWLKDECIKKKGMYNMEYTSFIFDVSIGFACGLLGLLHLLKEKKDIIPITGLIGFISGIVGFVLSFVYVVFNGIVYTTYYDRDNALFKKDSEGAFAVLNGDKYECFYHDEPENIHSIRAKYSDLRKKQYNYDKDLIASYNSKDVQFCKFSPEKCLGGKEIPSSSITPNSLPDPDSQTGGTISPPTDYKCKYLYDRNSPVDTISNKDLSDRFLTVLILSLIVSLANIGLAVLGILLFKNPGDFVLINFETVQEKI